MEAGQDTQRGEAGVELEPPTPRLLVPEVDNRGCTGGCFREDDDAKKKKKRSS